jgi:TolA-binding protein
MASVSYYFLYGCIGVLIILSTVVIYVISKLFNQNILEQQEKIRLKKNNDQHSKLILDLEERIQRLTDNKNTSVISKRENSKNNQSNIMLENNDKRIEILESEKSWFKIELDKAKDTIRDNTTANLRLCAELQ